MEITVAKNAGFCFGVKRATDSLEERIRTGKDGERIFTLGTIIHNGTYNAMLEKKGVRVTSIDEIEEIAKSATADSPVTVFIRAHGIPLEDEERLCRLAAENSFSVPAYEYRFRRRSCPRKISFKRTWYRLPRWRSQFAGEIYAYPIALRSSTAGTWLAFDSR